MKTIKQFGKKYVGSFVMLIVLMTITYYFIFRQCDLSELIDIIYSAKKRYLVYGVIMMFVHIAGEGVCLRVLGNSLNVTVGFIRSFCYACIDVYYCGITPSATGGQPVLAYYMSKDDIPIGKSTIVILLYTVSYKIVLLALGIVVFVFHRDFILHNGNAVLALFIIGIIMNIIIVGICLLCMYNRNAVRGLVTKTIGLLAKIRIMKHPERKLEAFYEHIEEYHQSAYFIKENRSVLVKVFVITLIQRIAMFSIAYFVYRSFGLQEHNVFDIIALQVVISITVDSLPLPGAVGVSEGMFWLLYNQIYVSEMLAPAMLLSRGIAFYFCLLLCGVVTIVYHIATVNARKVLKGE